MVTNDESSCDCFSCMSLIDHSRERSSLHPMQFPQGTVTGCVDNPCSGLNTNGRFPEALVVADRQASRGW